MRQIDADELRRRIIAFSTGSNTTYLTVENMYWPRTRWRDTDALRHCMKQQARRRR